MSIRLVSHGDYSKATGYFEQLKSVFDRSIFDKYGQMGVDALASNTPIRTGETANSWTYEVSFSGNGASLSFINTHENKGVNIAIILQYGHGTRNGGYVKGRDYINPAIQPVFDKITEDLWNEVTAL